MRVITLGKEEFPTLNSVDEYFESLIWSRAIFGSFYTRGRSIENNQRILFRYEGIFRYLGISISGTLNDDSGKSYFLLSPVDIYAVNMPAKSVQVTYNSLSGKNLGFATAQSWPRIPDDQYADYIWNLLGNNLLDDSSETTSQNTVEGARIQQITTRYERSVFAKNACLKHYKCICQACGLDFSKVYGEFASKCIHVHHLVPLSARGEEHKVDPIKDLRPLCPNCHAVTHKRIPPFEIDEIKKMLSGHQTTGDA